MVLPSGYTKLEYIESSGTQYIDTGFIPKGNSRVVMDFENTLAPTDIVGLFGARVATERSVFGMWLTSTAVKPQYGDVGSAAKPIDVSSYNVRQIYDLNKGVATVTSTTGAFSATFSQSTFNSGCALTLLAMNTNGAVDGCRASGKIYSAKIYDDGVLVRDFIPCKSADGTLGLWDNENLTFYANAGTGAFTAGKKHKVLIDSTGYEIKSGRVLIAGTGYGIKKGRTLIGGTGYNISFSTSLGELQEGSIVKINESGSPVEFYVAKHNYESDLNGTGRTLVVRKFCYNKRTYTNGSNGGACSFVDSMIATWLNNTYKDYLDAFIKTAISSTNNDYTTIKYTDDYISYTTATATCAIFLLSVAEIDTSNATVFSPYTDGSILPIADTLKIAYLPNSGGVNEAVEQWTRSWTHSNGTSTCTMSSTGTRGDLDMRYGRYSAGARPVFTLPAEMKVDSNFNVIET